MNLDGSQTKEQNGTKSRESSLSILYGKTTWELIQRLWLTDHCLQVDSMTLAYAIHRLDGIATPANAAYSASELEFQLKSSGAKALFTVCQLVLS
jgi:acyl-CoA synthetase (AMP-forming)/AMP-acid ligase II